VKREWIRPGTHINAIGADAPGKEELDPEILKEAKIVVDCWEQASHSGEINVPLSKGLIKKGDIFGEIGEVVSGKKPGREKEDEITIFDSTGLAIQDLYTATLVYREAKKKKIGKEIKIV
jgi:alanine dehydrogenase